MAKLFLPKQDNKSGILVDFGKDKSLSPLSLLPIPITQKRNGKIIGHGTGFLARPEKDASSLLITNYHVLTARHPAKPSMMLPGYPDSPDEIEFRIPRYENNALTFPSGSIKDVSCRDFKFMEHPDRDKGVDLVALKVRCPPDAIPVYLDQLPLNNDLQVEVGGDAFILGFPFSSNYENNFPTWKRASVASEPFFPIDGLPKIHMDTASRPGMSGSPVFIRGMVDKIWLSEDEAKLHQAVQEGRASSPDFIMAVNPAHMEPKRVYEYRFIGVYAGRYGIPTEESIQLGVVWSAQALEKLFSSPVITSHPFPIDA